LTQNLTINSRPSIYGFTLLITFEKTLFEIFSPADACLENRILKGVLTTFLTTNRIILSVFYLIFDYDFEVVTGNFIISLTNMITESIIIFKK